VGTKPTPQPDDPTSRPNRATRRAKRGDDQALPADGFVSDDAQAAYRRSSTLGGPTAKHISAARSAAGRRNQAKRDAR
jgi:hypothetical protein